MDDLPSHKWLGYSRRAATQKSVALLERIIRASSNPGVVVLDPFCGCGPTIDAAQQLNRECIGIDPTAAGQLAISLIKNRVQDTCGSRMAFVSGSCRASAQTSFAFDHQSGLTSAAMVGYLAAAAFVAGDGT